MTDNKNTENTGFQEGVVKFNIIWYNALRLTQADKKFIKNYLKN